MILIKRKLSDIVSSSLVSITPPVIVSDGIGVSDAIDVLLGPHR